MCVCVSVCVCVCVCVCSIHGGWKEMSGRGGRAWLAELGTSKMFISLYKGVAQ